MVPSVGIRLAIQFTVLQECIWWRALHGYLIEGAPRAYWKGHQCSQPVSQAQWVDESSLIASSPLSRKVSRAICRPLRIGRFRIFRMWPQTCRASIHPWRWARAADRCVIRIYGLSILQDMSELELVIVLLKLWSSMQTKHELSWGSWEGCWSNH